MHALVAVLLVAATSGPPGTQRTVLIPATGANVHPGHLAAATDVLRANLEATGKYTVEMAPVTAPDGREPTSAEAAEVARGAGAEIAFTLRISHLGSRAVVRFAGYRPDGTRAHADELTAATPDDLEPVLRRLAEGAATGRRAGEVASIDSVTERESDPYLKYTSTSVFGIRFGGSMVLGTYDDRAPFPAGAGIFWLYDARSYLADFSVEIVGGSRYTVYDAGIGVYYPLSRGNSTPYVGGGIAYGAVNHSGGGGNGLLLRAGGGYLLGRLSSVQVRIDGGVTANLFSLDASDGRESWAYGPYLTAGLGF